MQLTDTIDTLNGLLRLASGQQEWLENGAAEVRSPALAVLLRRQALGRAAAADELRALIAAQGGSPDESTSQRRRRRRPSAPQRARRLQMEHVWLLEGEWRDEATLARYRLALDSALPDAVRTALNRQLHDAERDHEQLRMLREAADRGRAGASLESPLRRWTRSIASQPYLAVSIAFTVGVLGCLAWRHAAQARR